MRLANARAERPVRARGTGAGSLSTLGGGDDIGRCIPGQGSRSGESSMSRRIFYDGLNLSLEHGTGIATYTRMLARIARELGYGVGAVYSSPNRPAKNPLLREIGFFDVRET